VGTRNARLNEAAFSLGTLVAGGHLAHAEVVAALHGAAIGAGLSVAETQATLDSGLRAGMDKPRADVPDGTGTGDGKPPEVTVLSREVANAVAAAAAGTPQSETDAAALSQAIRTRLPLIDWPELWANEEVDEWIVEPLLPARRLVALFSAPKVGKSLLMLELAVAVSRGLEVMGVPAMPHRVLYVDFENDPRGDVRERLRDMGQTPADLTNLCYLSYPRLAKLDTTAGGLELMAVAAEYQCTVVVIDTISRAVAGEENDNDTWLSFYRNTGMLLKAAGITCIRLDHTGKDAEKGMRGGSAKYGDVDVVWKLSKVTEDTYQLDCTDHRLPIAEKTIVIKRKMVPNLHHEVQAEGRMASLEAKAQELVAALDKGRCPDKWGRTLARRWLKEHTALSAKDNALDRALRIRQSRLPAWRPDLEKE
jgi:hypothetical protein